jgi:tetratricopeptide (TPR) repeat protein
LAEAAQAFQQAVRADGSYFEGHFNLALAQHAARDFSQALATWETALAIRPDSADARYNFALTLKAAGYAPDAAAELEKVLAANANDARAHLVLGNLYAEQLRDKARARVHYQRTLEIDARHPQATQIRYWLVANPA